VLIDGRSGSGKTELARALVHEWPVAQLLRLDDFYPGWHGLAEASAAVPGILTGLRWRAWDWVADRPGAWHELDPRRPVVVEGVGALSRASRALADLAVWVDLDDEARKTRALERDGDAFAPHWDAWAAQELEFIDREHPRALADILVDGRKATAAVGRILVELPS
jgi:uridine kinase